MFIETFFPISSLRTAVSLGFLFIFLSSCASLSEEDNETHSSPIRASEEMKGDDHQGGRENPSLPFPENLTFDQRLDQSLAEKSSLLTLIRELEQKPLSTSDRELHRALIQREMHLFPHHLNEIKNLNPGTSDASAHYGNSSQNLLEGSTQWTPAISQKESWWHRNRTGLIWSSLLLFALASTQYEIEVSLP